MTDTVSRTVPARTTRVFRRLPTVVAATLVAIAGLLAYSAPAVTSEEIRIQVEWASPDAAAQVSDPAAGPLEARGMFGQAVVAELPGPVDITGAETADRYRAGDIAYWAGNHSLYFFISDGSAVPDTGDLVLVGTVTHGAADLLGCGSTCTVQLDGPE